MSNGKTYNVTFLITGYINPPNGYLNLTVKFLSNLSSHFLNNVLLSNEKFNIIKVYKSIHKINP